MLQLYSSFVSALLVGFFWNIDLCITTPPTLYIDLVVDIFFLFEIALNFVTGVEIAGEYEDSLQGVAKHYLKNQFLMDLITSIPVSYVELIWIMTACTDEDDADNSSALRLTRVSKGVCVCVCVYIYNVTYTIDIHIIYINMYNIYTIHA